jgi:hypothetical protein
LITPLVDRAIGDAATQPAADATTELQSLLSTLCAGGSCSSNPATRTPTVVKAVCGAAVGNAGMLVQ